MRSRVHPRKIRIKSVQVWNMNRRGDVYCIIRMKICERGDEISYEWETANVYTRVWASTVQEIKGASASTQSHKILINLRRARISQADTRVLPSLSRFRFIFFFFILLRLFTTISIVTFANVVSRVDGWISVAKSKFKQLWKRCGATMTKRSKGGRVREHPLARKRNENLNTTDNPNKKGKIKRKKEKKLKSFIAICMSTFRCDQKVLHI